jgi:hypothetical protein
MRTLIALALVAAFVSPASAKKFTQADLARALLGADIYGSHRTPLAAPRPHPERRHGKVHR